MCGAFWLSLAALNGQVQGADPWEAKLDAVFKTQGYEGAHWGLLVVDGKTGKTVYEKNPDQLFCPASVTKLFTCASALVDLGPEYRFQTPIVRRGEISSDGTLKGDLILVASGDLSFGGRTAPDGTLQFKDNDHTYASGHLSGELVDANPLAGLDHLAKEVLASGVKVVTGDVLVDDRLFEPANSTGSGPSRVSPILINDNLIDVVITPGAKAGDPATVKLVPETSFVSFDAKVDTTSGEPASLRVRSVGPRRFSIRGRLPVGHAPVVKPYEVEEPAAYARAALIETLQKRGVRINASPLGDNMAEELPSRAEVKALPKVAQFTSPPLRESIKVILKVSHNLHASTLPLLLAAHHNQRTLEDGLRREGEALKSLGVDIDTISFGGGAGGDRSDLATPRATVALLRAMADRSEFSAYKAALPVLGEDGTLSKAVDKNSPARGHAHAKTGTFWVENGLNGGVVMTSKALAGYMDTASGRPLVFAFFVNEVSVPGEGKISQATTRAGRLLGSLCEAFYLSDAPEGREPVGK
ncbi:D-alanyl-D-alanine carboxypeptidase/D-alanyl-D-alanine endopeptidase [Singulisphaera sp. PoT]|uniref:D-alanyl-D-alanine carboxypeptidase/D-alanyl-D-alanine endopeptidase n=1 Tax=Singulisphaera sp. PoT TaxID=3411797 RepID=UPI003BF5BA69